MSWWLLALFVALVLTHGTAYWLGQQDERQRQDRLRAQWERTQARLARVGGE